MAMNPNGKSRSAQRDHSMFAAIVFFFTGCIAELFLFMVRRYYVNGYVEEALAWDGYLKGFAAAGAAVLIAGAALSFLWKKDAVKRVFGWALAALGVFLALSSVLIRMYMITAVTLFSIVVPVAMVLCVVWAFYDRECSVALSILCASLIAIWLCRRLGGSLTLGIPIRICAVVYLLLVAGLIWALKEKKITFILPANADLSPVYLAGALSAAGVILGIVSMTAAYYAMWCLGVVVFALAVYYTVKQL